jgi:hypothetical protein
MVVEPEVEVGNKRVLGFVGLENEGSAPVVQFVKVRSQWALCSLVLGFSSQARISSGGNLNFSLLGYL